MAAFVVFPLRAGQRPQTYGAAFLARLPRSPVSSWRAWRSLGDKSRVWGQTELSRGERFMGSWMTLWAWALLGSQASGLSPEGPDRSAPETLPVARRPHTAGAVFTFLSSPLLLLELLEYGRGRGWSPHGAACQGRELPSRCPRTHTWFPWPNQPQWSHVWHRWLPRPLLPWTQG